MSKLSRAVEVYTIEGLTGLYGRIYRPILRKRYQRAKAADAPRFRSAYGIEMTALWNDTTFKMCAMGLFGWFLANYLARQKQPFRFVDIGANQGLYSILAAKNPACTQIYAFEPVLDTVTALQRNMEMNTSGAKIGVIAKAVSATTGQVQINLHDNHTGGASLEHGGPGGQATTIETLDGAGFWQAVPEDGPPIIVKIDVEGHEEVVIEQLLSQPACASIVAIFYECDERWVDPQKLRGMLTAAGFTAFKKIEGGEDHHYDVLATRS